MFVLINKYSISIYSLTCFDRINMIIMNTYCFLILTLYNRIFPHLINDELGKYLITIKAAHFFFSLFIPIPIVNDFIGDFILPQSQYKQFHYYFNRFLIYIYLFSELMRNIFPTMWNYWLWLSLHIRMWP